MNEEPKTYPCPPIALIAVGEVQRRHHAELQEVLLAARAVSDVPEGNYTLDLANGVWVPRAAE